MSDRKKYSAEDVRKYLEGQLTPSEMHALEKEALSDPFLADAIEGMRQYENKTRFFEEADKLREALRNRVKRRGRIVAMPVGILWKAAAVLIIVVTGVAVIIYTGEKNNVVDGGLAKTEELKPGPRRVDTAQLPPADSQSPQASVLAESTAPAASETSSVSRQFRSRQPVDAKKDTVPMAMDLRSKKPDNARAENETMAFDKAQASSAPDSAAMKRSKYPEAEAMRALEGKAAGINQSSDEAVVTAYSNTKKRNKTAIATNSLQKRIAPHGGWDAFETYLINNRNPNAIDTSTRGIEKISFMINDNGRPSSFSILKSLSPSHDSEIIRLLDSGPSWEVIRGKKRKVTLSVIF